MSETNAIDSQRLATPSLWAGVIGAPLLWLAQLTIAYALVPWVCHTRRFFTLHLVTVLSIVAIAAGALVCWRDWQRAGGQAPDSTDGGRVGAARLTAPVGLGQCVLLIILLLVQWAAIFLVDPCWH
jgi:hypothetical protein